ncbi:MAG: lipoprotein signal peptidase [Bacteroides sp.]|nr:lipoprotein signal peptidase [Bacteroides sp.]MCM1414243.1 lipoprotein signal peptidase [Bacteroides sp.]MCM1471258.1 lipoprotein signal peptidase [Bacteroides sp.]
MKLSKGTWACIIIFAVIIIDQALKIWVKTHFYLGEEYVITDWFRLLFIENNGMAFGMELGSKLFLTIFRLCLAGYLIWYICKIKSLSRVTMGYIVCLSLIVAGAIGNIIDCMFYGVIFNNPYPPEVATLFPAGGGYASLFHGKVVDMLYFPLFSFVWPDWVPWIGGSEFEFFKPIFNFADAAISVGIIALILFCSRQIATPSALAAQSQPAETESPQPDETNDEQ